VFELPLHLPLLSLKISRFSQGIARALLLPFITPLAWKHWPSFTFLFWVIRVPHFSQ
jgi:hypothetical protein